MKKPPAPPDSCPKRLMARHYGSRQPTFKAQSIRVWIACISIRRESYGEDLAGLQELMMYGLKGTAAYADHAIILGQEDDAVYASFHEALDYLERSLTLPSKNSSAAV